MPNVRVDPRTLLARVGVERAVMRRRLRSVQERPLNRFWKFQFHKPIRGVQIVFATFVNYPDVAFLGGIVIWNYTVDLVQFQ